MTIHAGDSPGKLATTPPRPLGGSGVGWKLLASIAESSDDAIIGKTLDGVVTTWNSSAERIYGYRAEEIIGHSISLLIPPGLPDEMDEIMDRIRAGERADHYETVRRRKDGATIAVSLSNREQQAAWFIFRQAPIGITIGRTNASAVDRR